MGLNQTLLKLKHWQLFLLICSPQLIKVFIAGPGRNSDEVTILASAMFLFSFLIFLFWLKQIADVFEDRHAATFRWFMFPYFYMILFAFGALIGIITKTEIPAFPVFGVGFMICYLACIIHVAKVIKGAEIEGQVAIHECARDIFLLFIFPIGIWFVQPRVNKLFFNPRHHVK